MNVGSLVNSTALQRLRKAQNVANALYIAAKGGFRGAPPVFIDVGARWGLPTKWNIMFKCGLIRPVLFEPDPVEASSLRQSYRSAIVIESALGDRTQTSDLNITRDSGRSSLRLPDLDQLGGRYVSLGDYEVVSRVPITVTRLDELRDRFPIPDFIKIDTQGSDLDVLKGAGELLPSLLCIEIEVQLVTQYMGQALFHEIYDYLQRRDFGLVAFRPNGLPDRGGIIEGNAFFMRAPKTTEETTKCEFWRALMGIPTHREYCALSG